MKWKHDVGMFNTPTKDLDLSVHVFNEITDKLRSQSLFLCHLTFSLRNGGKNFNNSLTSLAWSKGDWGWVTAVFISRFQTVFS